MDKNIGEQLNKAYEAYRQACMDRDHAVKELQQKVCGGFSVVFVKQFFQSRIVVHIDFGFTSATHLSALELRRAVMRPGH